MPTYRYQYVREQRVTLETEGDTEEEAYDYLVNSGILDTLKLDSPDDESDDPGEVVFLEEVESDSKDDLS